LIIKPFIFLMKEKIMKKIKRFLLLLIPIFLIFIISSCKKYNDVEVLVDFENFRTTGYSDAFNDCTLNDMEYEYYRAYKGSYSGSLELRGRLDKYDVVKSFGGAFYNTSPIYGIKNISVSYRTFLNQKDALKISYGANGYTKSQIFDSSSSEETISIDCAANYYKIENLLTSDLYITEIKFTYNNKEVKDEDNNILNSGDNMLRNNVSFNIDYDNLKTGDTYKLPYKSEIVDGKLNVIEEHKYTYYDPLDLIKYETKEEKYNAAKPYILTDPTDVANYYMLFHTWPINYGTKDDLQMNMIFTSEYRCVSTYIRDDGYATSVPYRLHQGTSKPYYHELDIALNAYSSQSRGTGRLVVWTDGFKDQSYNQIPVIVYTDDHYATFQEYLNNGTYSNGFDAERHLFKNKYSYAKTI
jgi:hypothetical protein